MDRFVITSITPKDVHHDFSGDAFKPCFGCDPKAKHRVTLSNSELDYMLEVLRKAEDGTEDGWHYELYRKLLRAIR